MDKIDEIILESLRLNSRASNISIAKKAEVSEGTIRQRISKLKSKGSLKEFTINSLHNYNGIFLIETAPGSDPSEIIKKLKSALQKPFSCKAYVTRTRYDIIFAFNVSIDDHMLFLGEAKRILGIDNIDYVNITEEL